MGEEHCWRWWVCDAPRTCAHCQAANSFLQPCPCFTHKQLTSPPSLMLPPQIALLLSFSCSLMVLPWLSHHPKFLLVPLGLAVTPLVGGQFVRPVFKEAALALLGGLRLVHELWGGHSLAALQPQAQPLPLAHTGGAQAHHAPHAQDMGLHAVERHQHDANHASSQHAHAQQPWQQPAAAHAHGLDALTSGAPQAAAAASLDADDSQQQQQAQQQRDYHEFLEHHNQDPRRMSRDQKLGMYNGRR